MPGSEDGAATAYEQAHVHRVYEHIADHFAATRYKVRLPRRPAGRESDAAIAMAAGGAVPEGAAARCRRPGSRLRQRQVPRLQRGRVCHCL